MPDRLLRVEYADAVSFQFVLVHGRVVPVTGETIHFLIPISPLRYRSTISSLSSAEYIFFPDIEITPFIRLSFLSNKEQRGRTSKMGTKHPRKPKTNIETNEDLLAEVQRLRMENEYLKKLNALIQKRERSEKPTK